MLDQNLVGFLRDWTARWAALPASAGMAGQRLLFENITREKRDPINDSIPSAEHFVPFGAGKIRVRVFGQTHGTRPAMLYFHGGGWVRGSAETTWDITGNFARLCDMVVVSVDYALAPEAVFPLPVHQGLAVLRWMIAECTALGIDPARITTAGDSSGGNIAAAVTLAALDADVPLRAQLLIYPALDADNTRPSYDEFANGPVLLKNTMQAYWDTYCPAQEYLSDPLAAPLLSDQLHRLPPTMVAVAENDVLRDSGTAYADKARAAGADVTVDPGIGLIHGYFLAQTYCPAVTTCLHAMADWLNAQNAQDGTPN